jgi:hypothetical protein
MVSSVAGKVRRLEEATGGGRGGGGCGYCGGGDEDNPNEPYEIFFEDEEPEDLEEKCPECGREPIVIDIYFPEDPRAPWNVQ